MQGQGRARRCSRAKPAAQSGATPAESRAKKTTTSLDEEAIDETDNELEEETANSDHEDFISDGEHDTTGAEQRAMDTQHDLEHDSGNKLE